MHYLWFSFHFEWVWEHLPNQDQLCGFCTLFSSSQQGTNWIKLYHIDNNLNILRNFKEFKPRNLYMLPRLMCAAQNKKISSKSTLPLTPCAKLEIKLVMIVMMFAKYFKDFKTTHHRGSAHHFMWGFNEGHFHLRALSGFKMYR